MKYIYQIFLFLLITTTSKAQILGGGVDFSSAVVFDQSWLTNCPAGASTLSNQPAYEPTTTMDGCAPSPTNVSGTTESDVWFYFYAEHTTATIQINPSASFDIGIQALSGSVCNSLTEIGSVDDYGNNQAETLNLSSLTIGTKYYFRIYGATNSGANRVGTYNFCGTANLASTVLPVVFKSFNIKTSPTKTELNWITNNELNNQYFEIENSNDAINWKEIGKINSKGNSQNDQFYSFIDYDLKNEIYYRIKQIDIDGRFEYSKILDKSDNNQIYNFEILKNDNSSIYSIIISAFTPVNNILIYNLNGTKILDIEPNTSNYIFNILNQSKGIYILKISTNNYIYIERILLD